MPMLLLRSLIRMGDGGLVVTVPKGWAAFYGLKPGDKVELVADDEIIIRPRPKKKGKIDHADETP